MSALSTVEVLRGAKAVLGTRGWTQGNYVTGDPATGALCLRGAVNVAAGSPDPLVSSEAAEGAWRMLRRLTYDRYRLGPIGWNDVKDRTLPEVYALLDEAIERAEAGGSR